MAHAVRHKYHRACTVTEEVFLRGLFCVVCVFEAGDHQVLRFYCGLLHQRCVSPLKGRGLLNTPPWVKEVGGAGGVVVQIHK